MKNSRQSGKLNLGVFHISCWLLGMVAFVQLMSVGLAMSFRSSASNESPIEPEVVTRYVRVPSSQGGVTVEPQKDGPRTLAPVVMDDDTAFLASFEKVARVGKDEVLQNAPPILDPVVEELIRSADEATIERDLQMAHAKLREAEMKDPENPNVWYALGTNFEAFGVTDEAASYFMKVLEAGPLRAGSLYEKAAIKVAHGLVPDVKDLAMLGWGRMGAPIFEKGGERRTLILPVKVSPSHDFDPMLFKPRVRFYEMVDGKVVIADIRGGNSGSEWVTGKADWSDGEEMAEVWYFVPDQDAITGFLNGDREFYGFVAELYYDGRLVDICAQPRTLLRKGGAESATDELRHELDGLTLDDLRAGPSILPKLGN